MFFCGAFTRPVKIEIKGRANGKSELSGTNGRPLVCAHINHQGDRKGRRRYDYPENGLLVTDIEHLAQHLLFKENPHLIGLSTKHNDLSILSLARAVDDYNTDPHEEIQEQLVNGLNTWSKFYNIE